MMEKGANRKLNLFGQINEVTARALIEELEEIIEEDTMILDYNDKIKEESDKIQYKTVKITISSPGGDVSWGNAIINTLDGMIAPIHTHVIGECASMAIYIFLQGDIRTAGDLSVFGLHGSGSCLGGYVEEMKSTLSIIEKMNDILDLELLRETNFTEEEIKDFQTCLRWLNYEEALQKGLITKDIYNIGKDSKEEDSILDILSSNLDTDKMEKIKLSEIISKIEDSLGKEVVVLGSESDLDMFKKIDEDVELYLRDKEDK